MGERDEDAKARVRQRMIERLEELGFTARWFVGKMGYKDSWFAAIKDGRNALQLEDLDRAAYHLRTTPGDLVRRSAELFELRPSEARLIRALRLLPPIVQDYVTTLTEYLVGVLPDEVEVLTDYRELKENQQTLIRHWVRVLLLGGDDERALPVLDDLPKAGAGSKAGGRARRRGQTK